MMVVSGGVAIHPPLSHLLISSCVAFLMIYRLDKVWTVCQSNVIDFPLKPVSNRSVSK